VTLLIPIKFSLEVFAQENPYEFGHPFKRAAKLCRTMTKYVSLYNRDNKKLTELKNLDLELKEYTPEELAARVTEALEKNKSF